MNLLENGSFRVYCTVYELSSNNMLLFDLLWTLQFFLLFYFCLFFTITLKKLIMVCCAWNLNIFNNETLFYEAKKGNKNVMTF